MQKPIKKVLLQNRLVIKPKHFRQPVQCFQQKMPVSSFLSDIFNSVNKSEFAVNTIDSEEYFPDCVCDKHSPRRPVLYRTVFFAL